MDVTRVKSVRTVTIISALSHNILMVQYRFSGKIYVQLVETACRNRHNQSTVACSKEACVSVIDNSSSSLLCYSCYPQPINHLKLVRLIFSCAQSGDKTSVGLAQACTNYLVVR